MPRKINKAQDGNPYDAIRGLWEGAYVSQFLRLFQNKFGFPSVTTQELEDAIVEQDNLLVADVCARLLRFLTGKDDILIENFKEHLQKLVANHKSEINVSQDSTNGWQGLSAESKLGLLRWLVDHVYQEKEEDLAEYLDEKFNADDLRGICAGYDAFNNIYWYLDDLRLYRENFPKKPSRKDWECVCITAADWFSFLKQFRKTTNPQERELYTYLNYQLFPIIESQLQELCNRENKNIELDNQRLLERERDDLGIMLDKKVACNGSTSGSTVAAAVNTNGMDSLCRDNHNAPMGSTAAAGSETSTSEFFPKNEDQKPNIAALNHCDINSVESSANSIANSPIVIKPSIVSSAPCASICNSVCASACNSQEGCGGVAMNGQGSIPAINPGSNQPQSQTTQDGPNLPNLGTTPVVDNAMTVAPNKDGGCNTGDVPPVSAISNMVGSAPLPATTASIQPLPSNVMSKSSVPMETQYMQQQSQIFVFSTTLANKAAESVLSGQYPSIIAFHCAQPGTKRFLEKHPLKVQQFNRQNPAAWLNSLAQMKQGGRQLKGGAMNQFPGPPMMNHHYSRMPGPGGPSACVGPCSVHGSGPCPGPVGPGPGPGTWSPMSSNPNMGGPGGMGPGGSMDMMCGPMGPQSWSQQQHQAQFPQSAGNMNSMNPHQRFPNPMMQGAQNMGIRGCGPNSQSNSPMMPGMGGAAHGGPGSSSPFVGGPYQGPGGNNGPGGHMMNFPGGNAVPNTPSSLTGVKVPDENLTPQQRQHREEQLAMIRKMHQILFPDQHQNESPQPGSMMGSQLAMMGPQQNMMSSPMMQQRGQPRMSGPMPGGDMCGQAVMDPMYPHQPCMGMMGEHEHSHSSSDGNMATPPMMAGHHFPQQQPQQQQPPPHSLPPASVAAQLEWQKLQQQFYEERRRKQHGPQALSAGVSSSHSSPLPQPAGQQPPPSQQPPQQQQQPHTPSMLNSPSPSVVMSPSARSIQGPPPPYHQTPRGPLASPHPASPNPSSLSLPSPRTASGLPSPADPRQFPHPVSGSSRIPHPSPGTPAGSSVETTMPVSLNSPRPPSASSTPVSLNNPSASRTPTGPSSQCVTPTSTPSSGTMGGSIPISSPVTSNPGSAGNRKQSTPVNQQQPGTPIQDSSSTMQSTPTDFNTMVNTPNSSVSNNPDNLIAGHPLTPCSQQQSNTKSSPESTPHLVQGSHGNREPSLMPVPSPQQIQYLNAFDGQELTIQKQPNTSLRDSDLLSPPGLANSNPELGPPPHSQSFTCQDNPPGSFHGHGGVMCQQSGIGGGPEGMPPRYPGPSQPHGMEPTGGRFPMMNHQMNNFKGNQRFPSPASGMDGGMQRFPGPHGMMFDNVPRGPNSGAMQPGGMDGPFPRMPGQGHQGPGFGMGSPMSGNMDSVHCFPPPGSASEAIQRLRGPSPHTGNMEMMPSRFSGPSPHMANNDGMQPHSQFPPGSHMMPVADNMQQMQQQYPNPSQPVLSGSGCGGCMGNFNGDGTGHSHLQNLQKMTPPFDVGASNKMSPEMMPAMGPGPNTPVGMQSHNSSMGSGPLQPTSQAPGSQRLAHFDPIASMAAMSESTGALVSSASSSQAQQQSMMSTMNMSSMQVTNSAGGNQPSMVNFHTTMQSMQGVHQSMANPSGSEGGPHGHQYNMGTQMAHNMGQGPQTVNNTYVNATMSIQQLNIQNVTTSTYNPNMHMQPLNPPAAAVHQPMTPGSGAHTVSSSATSNHPIVHSAVAPKSSMTMNMTGPSPRGGPPPQPFPGQPLAGQRQMNPLGASMGPGMMPRTPGAAAGPYNSANIQVKASAPNTIQYLPARPQNSSPAPTRPPSLDFLQRFAAPLTNLDNKVPTHNLQYFPSGTNSQSGPNMGQSMPGAPSGPLGHPQGMMPGQRQVGMAAGANMMRGPVPPGGSGPQPMPGGQMYPGGEPAMLGRGPGGPGSMAASMMGMNAMGGGQSAAMFISKQTPLSPAGLAPDASQPLPPSMGHSFSYKQSPFYGPTTADPNYAVQFHNFQQQLYATNTRNSQMNSQNNLTSGQNFFGPK